MGSPFRPDSLPEFPRKRQGAGHLPPANLPLGSFLRLVNPALDLFLPPFYLEYALMPLDLPIIHMPFFPRWVWMEEITYSHIPIATLITAFLLLAPIFEYLGWRWKDLRYDRLARSLVFFAMILYSPGAALGTGIPFFIIGLYPEFWSRWSNLFFGPLMVQFVFFTLDVIVLFFFYYLPWDRMMDRKKRHIFFGGLTALFGLLIQAVWDGLGSYLMTPSAPLPGVLEPVGWSAKAFFNPSYPFLFLHRFFGNISYVMLITGGVLALKFKRAKDQAEKSYYRFSSDLTFSLGISAFFAMPFIGWFYARVIQRKAPVAFNAIMGGHVSTFFIVKMALIAVFVGLAVSYLFVRHRRKRPFLIAVTAAVASLAVVLTLHPPLDWLGSAFAWRAGTTIVLAGFIAFLWRLRSKPLVVNDRGWPWLMFVAGAAAFLAFALGGMVRERSKSPDTVYGQLRKPETTATEADRFLVYEKCVRCHHRAGEFERGGDLDWRPRVLIEGGRPGVALTPDEVERIVRYLEERSR
jgi:cytochrome bd-type quinol oxidase subunit 1